MGLKIKDGKKICRTCNIRKPRSEHHLEMQNTCLSCMGDLTVSEFRSNEHLRKNKRRSEKLKDDNLKVKKYIGDSKSKGGYLYLMYSPSLNIYKVGVGNNPFLRLKSISQEEYKIKDLKLLCIGNPQGRAFNCERYIHIVLDKYKHHFIKPNGGEARELFSCGLDIISQVFLSVCQEAYWINGLKKINIEFNKISLKEIGSIKRDRCNTDKVIANKILRESRLYKKKNIINNWKVELYCNFQVLKCYATGDRDDHLFESVFDKEGKCISLGLFKDGKKAKEASIEFRDFIRSERKSMKKKYYKLVWHIIKEWKSCGYKNNYIEQFLEYIRFGEGNKWHLSRGERID